jgi:hypothetical protein
LAVVLASCRWSFDCVYRGMAVRAENRREAVINRGGQ